MKYKKIPESYFITVLDRLTRFEPANYRYKRVFDDIINKFSLDTKLKNLTLKDEIELVTTIFNNSVKSKTDDYYINDILTELEDKYFLKNEISYQYLSARLNISAMLNQIKYSQKLPKNVAWLKKISENKLDIFKLRKDFSLLYPIEKIILCEGQTEFTLLETIFNKFDIDVNKEGILIIAAGGKNQVARKYYQMLEYVKIPFFILLDKDAGSIKEIIDSKIRKIDKIYLIKSGEFEDLMPKNILQKTINQVHKNEYNCIFDDFDDTQSMVLNLENIYKKYGFGEFKKAKFASSLKEYIEKNTTNKDFENSEILDIIANLK